MRTLGTQLDQMHTSARPSPAVLQMLATLISFQTVSRDSNLGLIEWVRDYLARLGVYGHLIYDESGRKANLFATLGEESGGGLLLSGHTDVVPVDDQRWDTDPFSAHLTNDRVYGRGTADMKGFLAVVLASAPQLLSATGGPFHLALSYDEEVGCKGAPGLIRHLLGRGIKPRGCIVGEPTGMRVGIAHKSAAAFSCEVIGRAAHAALATDGVNAAEYGARIMLRLREIGNQLAQNEQHRTAYEVPYSTVQTGVVRAGTAWNIVPGRCELQIDLRTLPSTDPDDLISELNTFCQRELLPQMRTVAPQASIEFKRLASIPALDTAADAPLARLVSELIGDTSGPCCIGFGTEAGLFQRAGIPAVLCGPGSMTQGHQPGEYITLEQLARCETFLHRLSQRPARNPENLT